MPGTIADVQINKTVTLLTDPTPRKVSKLTISGFEHEIQDFQLI